MRGARPLVLFDPDDPADHAVAAAIAGVARHAITIHAHGPQTMRAARLAPHPSGPDALPSSLLSWLSGESALPAVATRAAPPGPPRPSPPGQRLTAILARTAQAAATLRKGNRRAKGSAEPAAADVPPDALVLVPGWTAWAGPLPDRLCGRTDVRTIAVLDEPVALDWPEYAPPATVAALPRALAALARRAAMVVVPDEAAALRLAEADPKLPPIVIEPRPSALAGSCRPDTSPALRTAPFVVAWGPIETRGNTLLLLQIWRDLVARGEAVPRLLLAGRRGVQIEDIRPMLDWNTTLRPFVAEAPDLSPTALRTLLAHASALLAPDFAAPDTALLRDALACGVPVLATDTPSTRALLGTAVLSPIDGAGWREAILAAAGRPRAPATGPAPALPSWSNYGDRLLRHAAAVERPQKSEARPFTSQSP